jgi:hypothetical protein
MHAMTFLIILAIVVVVLFALGDSSDSSSWEPSSFSSSDHSSSSAARSSSFADSYTPPQIRYVQGHGYQSVTQTGYNTYRSLTGSDYTGAPYGDLKKK